MAKSKLGREIEAGLREAIAWKKGEIELPVRIVETMPAARVKEIRRAVAKSPKEFERRFGVPARTVEGWEQGRRVDVTAAVLLTLISRDPEAVERLVHDHPHEHDLPGVVRQRGAARAGREALGDPGRARA